MKRRLWGISTLLAACAASAAPAALAQEKVLRIAMTPTGTGPVTLKPGLAETWEQAADDKTTWIFHLRKGLKFHDGTDFNADAVIWSLERIWNKDSPQ